MAPKVEGRLLQALAITPGDSVLEIGTGSGYLTACLAALGNHVTSYEIFPDLSQAAGEKLAANGCRNVTLIEGDVSGGIDRSTCYDVIAVTGSLNQLGRVQVIGGINEKIEGFFHVCRDRGLNGEQAVIIPAANVKHLMLNKEVREAVAAGQFHIYAVRHVDECLSLLTGIDAGERDESGRYPEGTVNRRIVARLEAMADRRIALARSMGGKDKDAD